MNASAITFDSFKRIDDQEQPTWEMPLPNGDSIQIVKFDEDADKGYGYEVWLFEKQGSCEILGKGYFDGFGTNFRRNDVLRFVRAYARAFYHN